MKDWAIKSYNWARSNTRFVGINPWYWQQVNSQSQPMYPPNHSDVPGLRWLREIRQLYEKIGHEIINGGQNDIHF